MDLYYGLTCKTLLGYFQEKKQNDISTKCFTAMHNFTL